MVGTSLAKVQQ